MEEDIKILEEFIKYFEAEAVSRKYRRNISITVGEDDIEAIGNLIKRNKELEETLKDNWEFRDKFYIPKSKVKEKIEYIGKLYAEDEIDCEWYSEMKQLLQELLEE